MFQRSMEFDPATLVVIVSILLAFSLQLLLCFRAKRRLVRALPLAAFVVLSLAFSIACSCAHGWDSIGYLFFVLLFAALALVCGLTWGLCALIFPATVIDP